MTRLAQRLRWVCGRRVPGASEGEVLGVTEARVRFDPARGIIRPEPVQAPLQRLSIRSVLAAGLLATLALWLYTGYTFSQRLDDIERKAAEVAARYQQAQELLTTVRTQVLVASVRVRDALLNPDQTAKASYRTQIESNYTAIDTAISAYGPVIESDHDFGAVVRLRHELDDFKATVRDVLSAAPSQSTDAIRDLLNRHIVPRREAAVRISEEVQALNRAAFLQQQSELSAIHRGAEVQSARRLGAALATSLVLMLLAWIYASRLEGRLHAQIARSTELSREVQDAHARLLSAQEDERRTIARELHDEVGQVLTAVKVELGLAQREMERHGLTGAALLEAQTITSGAIGAVRDLTQLLHPAVLDDLGLVAATDAMLRGVARRQELDVRFSHGDLDDRVEPETEVAAYRIVQEALTNVGRHARASQCRVDMRCDGQALVLEVADNGAGFDPAGGVMTKAGLGLLGIRERVAHLGGTLRITTAPGSGTCLHVELPVRSFALEEVGG